MFKNRIIAILSFLLLALSPVMGQSPLYTEVIEEMNRAIELGKQGKYDEAIDICKIVSEKTKQQSSPKERDVFTTSKLFTSLYCYKSKRYEEGYTVAKDMLKTDLSEKDKEQFATLYVRNGYLWACSYIHANNANCQKGRNLLNEILPYANDKDDVRSKIRSKIPLSWYFEGTAYQSEQKYELALDCLYKSAEGYHSIADYASEINIWLNIGSCKKYLYDLKGAVAAYQTAADLSQQISNAENHMKALVCLRELYSSIGDYGEKNHVEAQMDSFVNSNCPLEVTCDYYIYKGDEARNSGQSEIAEQYYKKIENLLPLMKKPEVPQYTCHLRLCDLYLGGKKFDLALDYATKCRNEYLSRNIRNKNTDFLTLGKFVDIYKAKEDSITAKMYMDSIMVAEQYLSEPREISMLYSMRGRFYSHFKDWQKALDDFKKADQILATKYDVMDGGRIELLPFIGGAEGKLNRHQECEDCYKEYARRVKELHGEKSIEYVDAVNYLANAEGLAEHIEEGCKDYEYSVDLLKRMIRDQFPYLNSEQREVFWNPFSSLLTNMTPFAIKAKLLQDDFTRSCYDALVLSKAFLLEAERNMFDIIKQYGTQEDMDDYLTISMMKLNIQEKEKDVTSNADSIMRLTLEKEGLERKLVANCQKYGNITSFMSVDYESVKNSLSDGEFLIDFTDYLFNGNERRYAAYVIEKSQSNPLLLPLFSESKIDSLELSRPDMLYEEPYAEDVLNILWKPFESHVKEGATVYYVPSHILFQIALESIPLADGSLLGDHYNFVRLSSAREVGKVHDSIIFAEKNKSAVLYGGLKYDLSAEEMVSASLQYDVSPLFATRGDIVRGDSIFWELEETQKEIDAIDGYLTKSDVTVTPYSGINGTEESFLYMSGRAPALLHIATHGFYYTPEEAEKYNYLKGYKDAMSLSGLILSGANAAWRGKELPKGVLGGILTANDIARMDMNGTELVVLSACKTGQGKATSEGLYGLQRAFKKAGAQSMIMTLWSVSDVASREFMEKFYENLTDANNNWNKRKAFEEAKKYIRTKYKDDGPYYWAAFVMLD